MDCDDDDDEYVVRGTPLPELDEDTILNRKAAQDLTVRDEKGRQRFHGAFTGGFSAGYFNTVGTKQGWEPANFVSSRASKASSKSFHRKPEDFMDDEDFGEFGIAPKRIRTTADFSDKCSEFEKKNKHVDDFDTIIPGEPPLKELVKPVAESIGIAILRRLGWRPGQGIGPRVKRKESLKIVGCSLGPLAGDKVDSFLEGFTFAPDDALEVPYVPKDDLHGIGYTGLSTQPVLSVSLSTSFSNSTKSWLAKDQKKLSIKGQAFGIGALEDDDDGDVYSKEDMSQYDFSEFLGETSEKSQNKGKKTKCEYSSAPLQGFHLATHPPIKKKHFPLPDLPPGFSPQRKNKPPAREKTDLPPEISKPKMNHTLRSVLLGEKVFVKPGQPAETPAEKTPGRRSRFDQGSALPNREPLPAPQLTTPPLSVPPLMAVKFKPFAKDHVKQMRYEDFLSHNCDAGYLKSIQPPALTEWEKQLELDEFTRAASFYQPLSKELDSRFESRSHLDVETTSGIKKKSELPKEAPVDGKKNIPIREVFEWHPSSLLCKRFNVPNPYPDSKIDGVPGTEKKKTSLFDCLSFDQDSSHSTAEKCSASNLNEPVSVQVEKDVPNVIFTSTEKDDVEVKTMKISFVKEPVEGKSKPPMDLFKEIFRSSSSENSDSSDGESEQKVEPPVVSTTPQCTPAIKASEVNDTPKAIGVSVSNQPKPTRVAFGVFANLDLDALSKRAPVAAKPSEPLVETSAKHSDGESVQATSEENGMMQPASITPDSYCPELPPQGVTPVARTELVHKQYKHKHKHHKHKEKKSKKKKKHKYQKRKKDSSSSSDSEEEEILVEKIAEKLKKLHKEKNRK